MNKFIHSQQSLENHTRFQTKIGKVYTQGGVYLFSDRKGPKTPPVGAANTYKAYMREHPPTRVYTVYPTRIFVFVQK